MKDNKIFTVYMLRSGGSILIGIGGVTLFILGMIALVYALDSHTLEPWMLIVLICGFLSLVSGMFSYEFGKYIHVEILGNSEYTY